MVGLTLILVNFTLPIERDDVYFKLIKLSMSGLHCALSGPPNSRFLWFKSLKGSGVPD